MTTNPLKLYLPVAILLGLILCVLIPPNCVPDESYHYLRAEAVSRWQLWPRRLTQWGGGDLPQGVVDLAGSLGAVKTRDRLFTREDLLFLLSRTDAGNSVEVSYGTGGSIYTFLPYLPSAFALALTRIMGIRPFFRFYAGRFANLISASVLTYLAIRLFPGGGWPLFLLGTLPLTLQQYASLSVDALLISVFFLALTLIICGRASSIVAISALGWIKFPYVTILLGLLPSRWCRWVWIPVIVAVTAWVLTRQYIPSHHMEPGYAVSPADQLMVVTRDPFSFVAVVARTLWEDTDFWFKTLFTLGYLNVYAGDIAKYGWTAILVFSVLASRCEVPRKVCAWVILSVAIAVFVILLSQYLMWTSVGGPIVTGPQGRYFIPFLLCFAITPKTARFHVSDRWIARISLFGVALAFVCSTLASLKAYYGIGIE